jgi:pimeloyl-ACP methyl ester carboxylesterase
MADAILVPQVGQDLTEAKIVAISVKLGDKVSKGDIVAEVESEKATFEVEAFVSGIVISLPFAVGDLAPVLEPLMHLGQAGEEIGGVADAPAPMETAKADNSRPSETQAVEDGTRRSSPLARRVAAQNGLNLDQISGTGPRGAVVMRDVTETLQAQPAVIAAPVTLQSGAGVQSLQAGMGTPVVFLHGFGAELAAWRPLVARITVPNQMLGADLAGHGATSANAVAGFDSLVDDMARRLSDAGITSAHLVGHSLGAAVAVALADRGNLDIRSLTLIAPAGLGPWINGDFIAGFVEAKTEAALRVWMQKLVHAPDKLGDAMVRAAFAARTAPAQAGALDALARTLFDANTQLFSIKPAMQRLDCTCRVIFGLQDAILRPVDADVLLGTVAVHRLDNVGHLPQVEAATIVGRLISETIRSVA